MPEAPRDDPSAEGLFAFLSRRRFLKASLVAGGAVLGLAGGGLLLLRGRAPSVDGLRVLDDHEYQTLRSLVEVMFPRTDAIPVDVTTMDLPRAFDGFLADEPEHSVSDLQKALVLVELGPLIYDRRLSTFSRLDPAERALHWESWGSSDDILRRQVNVAMRMFFYLVFFDREDVWPFIGYGGPSFQRRAETPP